MKRERLTQPRALQTESVNLEAVQLTMPAESPHAPLYSHSLANVSAFPSGGAPLQDGLRSGMERAFGTDFSDVRVSENPTMAELGAEAMTLGSAIHFRPGAYNPGSLEGRELLGHELAHVVQQGGRSGGWHGFNLNQGLEAEADSAGSRAARGQATRVASNSASGIQAKFGSGVLNKIKKFFGFGKKDGDAPANDFANVGGLFGGAALQDNDNSDAPQANRTNYRPIPAQPSAKYDTTPLNAAYANEQVSFSEDPGTRTKYLSDGELAQHHVSFQDGLAMQGGDVMDTQNATHSGNLKSKTGRNIFTMNDQGEFYAADGMKQWLDLAPGGQRFHHSSLAQGQNVAGAGELEVNDGHVTAISDQSGHYRPQANYTYQVAQQLDSQNALRDTRPDENGFAVNRPAKVELQSKPGNINLAAANPGHEHSLWNDEITLTSDQFLQTGGNERQIREKMLLNTDINSLRSDDESENTPSQVLTRLKEGNLATKAAKAVQQPAPSSIGTQVMVGDQAFQNQTEPTPAPKGRSGRYRSSDQLLPSQPVTQGKGLSGAYAMTPGDTSQHNRTPAEVPHQYGTVLPSEQAYVKTPADAEPGYSKTLPEVGSGYPKSPADLKEMLEE